MRFLAGLALFFLGLHLVAEALWAWKGRRGLLARVLDSPFLGLLYGLLLGAFSGSGSGLGLLALALLEVGVLTHAQAALLALAATAGPGSGWGFRPWPGRGSRRPSWSWPSSSTWCPP
ncbi:MAG: hypothetical protein ACO2OU_06545 [Thermus aquaticus]|uniref:hypothetical protein n=1 Tax=Thermus aquaticus TaxID=271 RepID=UPI003BFDF2BB